MSRRSNRSSYRGNQYGSEPLRGRKLWRYGDWGNAGEHIGRHWEGVAAPILRDAIGHERAPIHPEDPAYAPRVLISIATDPDLAAEVQQSSLAHADSLMLGYDADGHVVAEPADFKWSLETAEARQVSAGGLARLLNAGLPLMESAIAAGLGALAVTAGVADLDVEFISGHIAAPAHGPVREPAEASAPDGEHDAEGEGAAPAAPAGPPPVLTRDGIFFSPVNQANERFLHGDWNGRKAEPLQENQVWFQPFEPIAFFSPLPGWDVAELLAGYDRSTAQLELPDGAERYYRLGAGTRGALIRWHTSIFSAEPADIDVPEELEALRRAQHLWTSTDISLYLDRMMNVRAERENALQEWLREIYGWSRFRDDLTRLGGNAGELESKGGRRRWGFVFSTIQKAVRARICGDGLAQADGGASDMEALEALQGHAAEYAGIATAVARHTISTALAERGSHGGRVAPVPEPEV